MKNPRILRSCFIFALATVVVAASPSFSKDLQMSSQWATRPIQLDGKISDWPEGTTSFLGIPEATFGICNDSERAYIVLAFRRTDWARLIHMSGLNIWLDGNGKKQKGFMLHFVGGPPMEDIMALAAKYGEILPGRADSSRQERMKDMESRLQNKFACAVKEGAPEQAVPTDGSLGPAVAFGIDQGFFVYEFSVPLKASTMKQYGLGVSPNQNIGVDITWGEFDRGKMRRPMPDMGGGMPPGGEGGGMPPDQMGGGGEGRGERGGFGGGRMAEKQEIWLKAQLANSRQSEDSMIDPGQKR